MYYSSMRRGTVRIAFVINLKYPTTYVISQKSTFFFFDLNTESSYNLDSFSAVPS